jgi:hypothetical protein
MGVPQKQHSVRNRKVSQVKESTRSGLPPEVGSNLNREK